MSYVIMIAVIPLFCALFVQYDVGKKICKILEYDIRFFNSITHITFVSVLCYSLLVQIDFVSSILLAFLACFISPLIQILIIKIETLYKGYLKKRKNYEN